jgi:predicted Zn-dependent protease
VKFANRVIGKAFRGTMCSYDFSGGVIVNDDRIAFTASTVAHEMGHNFGMEHDLDYPDPCKCAANLCIMSPQSGAYVFSKNIHIKNFV